MAHDEELEGFALTEERNHVELLQAEAARKEEEHDRLHRRKLALKEELSQRELELQDKTGEYQAELKAVAKLTEGASARTDKAVNEFMNSHVTKVLQERLPVMAPVHEELDDEQGDDDEDQGEDDLPRQHHEDMSKPIHDTVAVIPKEACQEDVYLVSYRICKDTTVEMLHRDACDYWGCLPADYALGRVDKKDTFEDLWEKADKYLQDHDILDLGSEARLYLVPKEEIESFKVASEKKGGKDSPEKKQMPVSSAAVETEPFVDALKAWTGIHSLLRKRNKTRHTHWIRVSMTDLVLFALLILTSGLSIAYKNTMEYYLLRHGTHEALVSGFQDESSDPAAGYTGALAIPLVPFDQIRRYNEITTWLGGTFHYQVFDNRSTLRRNYLPVGFLRVRQQRAKEKVCVRTDVPLYIARPCYHNHISTDTEDTEDLYLAAEAWNNVSGIAGREFRPHPLRWHSSPSTTTIMGMMQRSYDGTGYSVVYNLSPENFTAAGAAFLSDLPLIRDHWVDKQTRMIIIELTLANYNFGGYTSANFLLELSPSGAIHPIAEVLPFHIGTHYGDRVALGFDVVRWVLVVGYIMFIRVFVQTRVKVVDYGKSGLNYVFSFSGLIDELIVATFVAIQAMEYKPKPPAPSTLRTFHSYSYNAIIEEWLVICEGSFFLLLMVRYATFTRMVPQVNRIVKVIGMSMYTFAYFGFIFVPTFFGAMFLAHCIWSPYLMQFTTWNQTFMTLVMFLQKSLDLAGFSERSRMWSVPFLMYFFLVFTAFLMFMFLAIIVHTCFEVDLLHGSPEKEQWSPDQWLDWMLWPSVYKYFTGKVPGSSRQEGYAEGGEEDDDEIGDGDEPDDDDDDDDEDGNAGSENQDEPGRESV